MRLIDADALLENLKKTDRYFMLKFDIEEAPTIEPDRPHGEWIIRRNKEGKHIYSVCSKCNVPYLETDFPNFCPNCGSDNRKKEGESN